MEEDLQIYHFSSLHDEGQEDSLAHLLDEGDDQLDALTFGLDDDAGVNEAAFGQPVGKDFDFAGSTSRFLGTTSAHEAGLKPVSGGWLDPSAPSASASAGTPAGRSLSPWTSLDDDPLLGSGGGRGVAPPVPQPQQQQYKTLEQVEAELRAARPAPAPAGAAVKTLAEVEAEMLARQRAPPPPPQAPAAAASPAPAPAFPPQAMPPGMGMAPGLPPPLAAQLGLPPGYPLHLLPPHLRAQFPPHLFPSLGMGPPPPPGFPGSPVQGAPVPPGMGPGMGPGVQMQMGSPAPQAMQMPLPPRQTGTPQPPSGPPTPGPGFPPLGAPVPPSSGAKQPIAVAGQGGVDLMATLFPPLPSQSQAQQLQLQQQQQVASLQALPLEQQLAYLTLHGGAQHPSLTGAQLHSLLQGAQRQRAAASEGEGAEGAGKEEEERKKAAEELVRKVEERIWEHEKREEGRKRKAAKIAAMAKHNNLMSNSDKDFITRIQVSQLVTDDPYADDFYFHIMAAIKASRAGVPPPGPGPQGPQQQPQGGGGRRGNRRDNAMNRMAQNVQRLVDSAKKRNAEKGGAGGGAGTTLSLDGALGKIATRTRSAPRPLLQVKPSAAAVPSSTAAGTASPEVGAVAATPGAAAAEGPSTGESLLQGAGLITSTSASTGKASPSIPQTLTANGGGPLSYRASLIAIEKVYDLVLDLEQLRRIQPNLAATVAGLEAQGASMVEGEVRDGLERRREEAQRAVQEAQEREQGLRDQLWRELRVLEPLDACTPHPFVSLLSLTKGKRILPRAIRHLSPEQTLTLLTLIVATFSTLDVVVDAPILDALPSTPAGANRPAVEAKTEALLAALVPPVMAVVGAAPLRMVTGMLGLLMDRNDVALVARTKPGLAFLTILLSRAEGIKQAHLAAQAANAIPEQVNVQDVETDLAQWSTTFSYLFSSLASATGQGPAPLLALFPSTRLAASLPFGFTATSTTTLSAIRPSSDADDEPVWRFLAALAVCAGAEQQQALVTGVRDKVVENVREARRAEKSAQRVGKGMAALGGGEVGAGKLRNVNLLLHALSLDASMIETDED
ncbi:hypothetical protein JCM10207_007046 [Rhodosporidiobolus poonsookiae]